MAKKTAAKKPAAPKKAAPAAKAPHVRKGLRAVFLARLEGAQTTLGRMAQPRYKFADVARELDPGLDFAAHVQAAQEALVEISRTIDSLPGDWKPAPKKTLTPEQIQKLKDLAAAIQAKLDQVAGVWLARNCGLTADVVPR